MSRVKSNAVETTETGMQLSQPLRADAACIVSAGAFSGGRRRSLVSRGCNPRSATVEALTSYYDDEYESYYDSEDEGMAFASPVQIEINENA